MVTFIIAAFENLSTPVQHELDIPKAGCLFNGWAFRGKGSHPGPEGDLCEKPHLDKLKLDIIAAQPGIQTVWAILDR